MTAEPPLLTGAVNTIEIWALPAVIVPKIGAPGTVRGVPDVEPEAVPVPTELIIAS